MAEGTEDEAVSSPPFTRAEHEFMMMAQRAGGVWPSVPRLNHL